jgi:hypothetical protein
MTARLKNPRRLSLTIRQSATAPVPSRADEKLLNRRNSARALTSAPACQQPPYSTTSSARKRPAIYDLHISMAERR